MRVLGSANYLQRMVRDQQESKTWGGRRCQHKKKSSKKEEGD
jgi:hypothetical protein